MTNRDRFLKVLNFEKIDRLPMIEWAPWWDLTIERWKKEGLEADEVTEDIKEQLGLDMIRCFYIGPEGDGFPWPKHGKPVAIDEAGYREVKKFLFPTDQVEKQKGFLLSVKEAQEKGDAVFWFTLTGFFGFPREILGIEEHLCAFYESPELMHEMNRDMLEYNKFLVEEICKILKPDFMTFFEDMSYNHGSMISYEMFKEFMLPYYKELVPVLKNHGIVTLMDTDGNCNDMIPWMIEAGLDGVLPLEKQAGTDVVKIREKYPNFVMIGGYDKMVMSKGEAEMRAEFERLLPVMKSGGFIPACDHQTPPQVSFENYKIYMKLLKEYCEKAVK